jgi:arylsulfatase A-like enzyme
MDDSIGVVLSALDRFGYTQDTLVVYTSDQGYFLGEHNAFDKRFMWEESIRVPCAIRY